MYYTIISEEKAIKHSQINASIFTKSNALTTFMSPRENKEKEFSTNLNNTRTNNLSYLVGKNIHMHWQTSFLQSQTLRTLAPTIQNSYKTFIVSFIIFVNKKKSR